jgi:hypothetical protein
MPAKAINQAIHIPFAPALLDNDAENEEYAE